VKEKIKDKIIHLDFNFDANEKALIVFDDELIELLIKVLKLDYRIWTKDLLDFMRDDIEADYYTDDDKFLVNYCKAGILYDQYFTPSFLTAYKEEYLLNSHYDELVALTKKRVNSKDYVYSRNSILAEDLEWLLDAKRYEDIEKTSSISIEKKDLKLFIRLMNEYPWNSFEFPLGLLDSRSYLTTLFTKHYNKLSYNAILKASRIMEINNFLTPEVKMRFYQLVTSPETDWNGCIFNREVLYRFIANNFSEAQRNEIILSLFKKGDYSYVDVIVRHGLKTREEINQEVINHIDSGNEHVIKSLCSFSNFNPFILEDSKVCQKLVDVAEIKPIIESPEASKYIDVIVDKINNEDPVYMEKINSFDFAAASFPKLVKAILNCKHTKKIYVDDNYLLVDESQKIIEDYLSSDSPIELMPNCKEGTYLDSVFSLVLLKAKKYDLFFKTLRFMEITPSMHRELYKQVCDNEEFYKMLIEKDPSLLINNRDLVNYYVKRKEYIPIVNDLFRPFFSIIDILDKENIDIFLEYLCEYYGFNYKHVLRLKNKFGLSIFEYMRSQSIDSIITLDDDKFNKFMSLFETKEYSLVDIAAAYDNIKQKEFEIQNSEIMNTFTKLKYQLENDCLSGDLINAIIRELDESFFDKHNINKRFKEDPRTFVFVILNDYKKTRSAKSLDLLREITNHYIAKERENYHETYNLLFDVDLEKKYDEKSYKSALFNFFVSKNPYLPSNSLSFNTELRKRLKEKGLDDDLIDDLFAFYINKKAELKNIQSVVTKELYSFRAIGEQILEEYYSEESLENYRFVVMNMYEKQIKYKWGPGKPGLDMYKVFSLLRKDHIDTLLGDEKSFNALKEIFKKRKLHLLPDGLLKFINENELIDIHFDEKTLATFISYFKQINEHSNGDSISLFDVINKAKAYSQVSSVYSQILTAEDALLISANEGSLQAVKKTHGTIRLDESVMYTKNNYLRKSVTVPTFNKIYTINGKKLRVVLGNYTNPCNVSFGERDDSCMRLGGPGEGLYDFCLSNVNGFHVRFEDAKTDRYVSRVSGFRNGNSVFLNQLRHPCTYNIKDESCDKFTDVELYEVTKWLSKDLIAASIESTYPIDNVIIHKCLAVPEFADEVDLGIDDPRGGLPYFYTDILKKDVVLATRSEDGPLVPIKFSKTYLPLYETARDEIRIIKDIEELNSFVNRIHSIKLILEGNDYHYIEPVSVPEFKYAEANNDWYIYVDMNDEIHMEVISVDQRAVVEASRAKERIESERNGGSRGI